MNSTTVVCNIYSYHCGNKVKIHELTRQIHKIFVLLRFTSDNIYSLEVQLKRKCHQKKKHG